jgi:protease I
MAENETKHGKVACLLASGFEDSEFRIPAERLRRAGYQVEVIGLKAGEKLLGDKGKVTTGTDLAIADADVDDYVALLIPGGRSPDKLRADDRFVEFVKDFDATKRPLAAVCHGPQLLLTAELQRGRTLTAWKTIQGDLRQAGALVKDEQVVVDDNWITSRKPEDLEAFAATLIEALDEAEEQDQIQASNEQAIPPPA